MHEVLHHQIVNLPKLIYTHTYSEDACCIASEIKTEYPDVDFRIFELTQLNSFVNH